VKKPAKAELVVFDAMYVVLFTLVAGPPAAGVGWLATLAGTWIPAWANAALLPAYVFLFLFGMTITTRAIRLFVPRLEPGTYRFPKHRLARAWVLHFGLQRILYLPLWRPLYFQLATLRTAMLRALGADVALDISTGSDPQLLDPSLVTIERGAVIGASVMTTCHFMLADRLKLARVTIREGAQLHEAVKVGPGSTVGKGAVLGAETLVGVECEIGDGARVGPGCRLLAEVKIGAKAKLDEYVTCERNVTIGEKARVASGSYLPRGTVVPSGGRYPVAPEGDSVEEPASDRAGDEPSRENELDDR
jgi:acetyltransferase-like isoleucine patch superfamily enzyme